MMLRKGSEKMKQRERFMKERDKIASPVLLLSSVLVNDDGPN
jgi:hypothetical protein